MKKNFYLVFKIYKFIFILIFFYIIFYLIWYFPVQKILAIKDFNRYIMYQGTNKDNILYRKIFKDFKCGGYNIRVIFKDDFKFIYEYNWQYNKNLAKNKFHIDLYIRKNENNIDETYKYPSLNYYNE